MADLLAHPHLACWLIAIPAFRRRHYPQRAWLAELVGRCPDLRQAFVDWMAQDDEVASHLATAPAALCLVVRGVDGDGREEETVAALARHFRLAVQQEPQRPA